MCDDLCTRFLFEYSVNHHRNSSSGVGFLGTPQRQQDLLSFTCDIRSLNRSEKNFTSGDIWNHSVTERVGNCRQAPVIGISPVLSGEVCPELVRRLSDSPAET
ncbi:hypothetical protein Bbelb_295420 [Branchiostoma belcheri]|nr:hypothetical protein Bbelb_295420 [Branchiostoma belcheri]